MGDRGSIVAVVAVVARILNVTNGLPPYLNKINLDLQAAARAFAVANNKKTPGNSRIGSETPDGSDGGENLTRRRNSMKPSRRSDEIIQASEK